MNVETGQTRANQHKSQIQANCVCSRREAFHILRDSRCFLKKAIESPLMGARQQPLVVPKAAVAYRKGIYPVYLFFITLLTTRTELTNLPVEVKTSTFQMWLLRPA